MNGTRQRYRAGPGRRSTWGSIRVGRWLAAGWCGFFSGEGEEAGGDARRVSGQGVAEVEADLRGLWKLDSDAFRGEGFLKHQGLKAEASGEAGGGIEPQGFHVVFTDGEGDGSQASCSEGFHAVMQKEVARTSAAQGV